MNSKKNIISALILQSCSILQGFILPRLIIGQFGSDVNGLISSILQFLSFITLLEGGLGAVVLAELYMPISKGDKYSISKILNACRHLFRKLGIIFIVYTGILILIYPRLVNTNYSFIYVSSLIAILSFGTLAQYLFAITNKLFLQANQKIYIVNIVTAITILLNLIISILLILIYPDIHIIKMLSGIIYLIQPIAYNKFVDKKYINKSYVNDEKYTLNNRWSGFAQNLAHFVNMNTDIAVLTLFSNLFNVSIYTVYMLPINALRQIMSNVSNSYQSTLGKCYVENDTYVLKQTFTKYESINWLISLTIYFTCLITINPFIQLYTAGIHDANYYQPEFAIVMTFASMFYCIREPYRSMILAAGKFKDTNFGSIMEAILNLGVSLLLVPKLGLVGVAIGTLVAITYRFIYFIYYLKKEILKFEYKRYYKLAISLVIISVINLFAYYYIKLNIDNFIKFFIFATFVLIVELIISSVVFNSLGVFKIKREALKEIIKKIEGK